MRTKSLLTCLLLNTVALAQSLSAKDVWVGEENTLQEIVTWWRRMAVMKPLPNCQKVLNKPFDGKQFHHLFANMSVRYYAEICTSPEEGQSYQHRGKLKNGLPEGGVKLFKLPQKQVSYENDGGHHICYHFSPFMGFEVTQIAGRFLDGALQGQARLTLGDEVGTTKRIVIGNFNRGYLDGIMREFNFEGKLIRVTYSNNSSYATNSWRLLGSTLVNENERSGINLKDIRGVFFKAKTENGSLSSLEKGSITGVFHKHTSSVTQIRDVKSISLADKGKFDNCVLELEVEEDQDSNGHTDEVLLLRPKEGKLIKTKFSKDELQKSCQEEILNLNENHASVFTWLDDLEDSITSQDGMFWGMKFLMNHLPKDADLRYDPDNFLPILTDIVIDFKTYNHSARIQGGPPLRISLISAGVDEQDRLHGNCHLQVHNDDLLFVPKDHAFGWRYTSFKATFDHGSIIDGVIVISTEMESLMLATIKHGTLHGPVLSSGVVPLLPIREGFSKPSSIGKGIGYVGFRRNGYLFGTFWLAMQNFGYLHGTVDSSKLDATSISGDAHSFIFYDGDLAMVGKFEDRVMKDAGLFRISEMGCNTLGLPQVFSFVPHTGEYAKVRFWYDPADNVTMGGGPPGVPDPYESKVCSVEVSAIPDSGEGIIAKVDIPVNRPASIYTGNVLNEDQQAQYSASCTFNLSLSMDERRHCFKYSLKGDGYAMNIQPKFDNHESFCLGKGPKANHQFSDLQNPNVYFDTLEHPRWGLIMGLVTSRPVARGEELFVDYGYTEAKQPPEDLEWYWELKRKLLKEKRMIQEDQNRKKANSSKRSKKSKKTVPTNQNVV